MGFLGFGEKKEKKRTIWDIPDEELSIAHRHWKKWNNGQPFIVKDGTKYDQEHKGIIDHQLYSNLGCSSLDDLLEMKAPTFFYSFYDLYNYVKNNVKSNNQYQQLLGQYEEIQKRCEQQEAMIEKLMAQNEKLQNQLIEKVNTPPPLVR